MNEPVDPAIREIFDSWEYIFITKPVLLNVSQSEPGEALRHCLGPTLTYHSSNGQISGTTEK